MKNITVSDETWDKIKSLVEEEATTPIKELNDLIGLTLTFWCARYIYHGTVEKVDSLFITLKNASIVYDTGDLSAKEPLTKEALPKGCQILWSAVESFQKLRW